MAIIGDQAPWATKKVTLTKSSKTITNIVQIGPKNRPIKDDAKKTKETLMVGVSITENLPITNDRAIKTANKTSCWIDKEDSPHFLKTVCLFIFLNLLKERSPGWWMRNPYRT